MAHVVRGRGGARRHGLALVARGAAVTHFVQSDARALPFADGAFDLTFTSPPYLAARTYGIGAQRGCEEWVDWMLGVVAEACRVTTGLVIVNCAGTTKDWRYNPGPEGLLWKWWAGGGECWRPAYWHRVGIPGSGGKQWLRADVEYLLAFKGSPGKIPWADPCVMGQPPVCSPGGDFSNRTVNGLRVNQWTLLRVTRVLNAYAGTTAKAGADQVLSELQDAIASQTTSQWFFGIVEGLRESGVLQSILSRGGKGEDRLDVQGECAGPGQGAQGETETGLRDVWGDEEPSRSPQGRESAEQRIDEPASALQFVPPEAPPQVPALHGLWSSEPVQGILREALHAIQKAWRSDGREGQSILAADPYGVGRSSPGKRHRTKRLSGGEKELQFYRPPPKANPGVLVRIAVGGGKMGHPYAHINEAPFPEGLPEFFIKSFCPPRGRVLDQFSGSGTTACVASRLGRIGVGCDLRMNQCELGRRRFANPVAPKKPKRKAVAANVAHEPAVAPTESSGVGRDAGKGRIRGRNGHPVRSGDEGMGLFDGLEVRDGHV